MRFFSLFVFLLLFFAGLSQSKNDLIQQRIEAISEQLEQEELDLTNLTEQLNFYFDNPINLNNTSFDELKQLGLLSDIQIQDLLLHIRLNGKLLSKYELQALRYWDLSTIESVLPFIYVDERLDKVYFNWKDVLKYGKSELFLRYQTTPESKMGYNTVADSIKENSNSYYWGNKDRYYSRYHFAYRSNISFGVTAEKDPGEQFFKSTQQNGFDFYSAHAYYNGGKYLKTVALGDYQLQIGQGLNVWTGYAFGKTSDIASVKKNAQGIRPYTSVDENRFFRGAAVDLGFKTLGLQLFASQKMLDAQVKNDSTEYVSSIDLSGNHRTTSERNKMNSLQESVTGFYFYYKKNGFSSGICGSQLTYSLPYIKAYQPYNQFDFRGNENRTISADYSYVWKNMNLFGEFSRVSFSDDLALLQGLVIALDNRASLSLLYRNYQKGYSTSLANGFGESSSTQNEKGIYTGLKHKLSPTFTMNSYIDFFQSDWLKYQVDGPSVGYEFLGQLTYKPTKTLETYVRFREQNRQKNSRFEEELISTLENVVQRNYRFNLSYQISDAIQLKTRVEFISLTRPSCKIESGVLLAQDLSYKPKNFPLDISLRYALFDTDSYDTRIYTYESNAQYVFSVPAYYYQGSRAYINLKYNFLKRCDLWLRYGVFIYSNKSSISSGAEQINGNTKSDVTIQLRVSF